MGIHPFPAFVVMWYIFCYRAGGIRLWHSSIPARNAAPGDGAGLCNRDELQAAKDDDID